MLLGDAAAGEDDLGDGALAARVGVEADLGAVELGDLADDGQAEAGAALGATENAVEALEDALPVGFGHADAGVFDFDDGVVGGDGAHGDAAAFGGVFDGVVDEVLEELGEEHRVAVDDQRLAGGLEAEVDVLLTGAGHEVAEHGAQQAFQLNPLDGVDLLVTGFGAGQGQQLVDEVAGALGAFGDLPEGSMDLLGVSLHQRQVGLHAQAGERGAHLVGGVGDEALLGLQVLFEAGHHVVEGDDQRPHLLGHTRDRDRRKIRRTAPADVALQVVERRDAAGEAKPDEDHRDRDDRELGQQHAGDDPGGQRAPLVAGFGDLQQHVAAAGAVGGLEKLVGDADVLAGDLLVAEHHQVGLDAVRRRDGRDVLVADEELALQAEHLVIHGVVLVGPQYEAGRRGKVELGLVGLDLHEPGDGPHIHRQRLVVGLVGDAVGDVVGDDDGDRPQKQQWREHPVEDLAEERVEGLAIGARCVGRLAPPRRPHPAFPGSNPGPAR